MSASLLAISSAELLDRISSSSPTPGGGSAAALAGAAAAALVTMVAAMSKTRTGSVHERTELDRALAHSREAGERLRSLVDEDAQAYAAVVEARRRPHLTEEDKAAREVAIEAATVRAVAAPLETARQCMVALGAASLALAYGNPRAASDARTAGALAWAGLMSAVENVKINLEDQPQHPAVLESRILVQEAHERLKAFGLES